MNSRSITVLNKFLSKIDRGEPEPQEDDIDPRSATIIYNAMMTMMLLLVFSIDY